MRITALLLASLIFTSCGQKTEYITQQPQPTPVQNESLTRNGAEKALNAFAIDLQTTARITGGIREVPTQNQAVAEVEISEWKDPSNKRHSGAKGKAIFTKYSGEGWYLTEVSVCCSAWIDAPNRMIGTPRKWTTKKDAR